MKPCQLTISAWGPYPGKVHVDFTRFQEGSVFLVTGPTGAGKTTIFDAISYALYGNVSGSNRDKTSVRSDFAAPEADTFVDFTFTHKGSSYHIYRTPKYERPKKRGEGMTTSAETATLTIGDLAPIASVQDVNHKVEEIMGINYEQFKQIAMIAQGEFLSLLFAKSEEKVDIFRNLFKTQIYDKILRSLTEKCKNLYSQIKEHNNKMDEAVAGISADDNEELQQMMNAADKNYEQIIQVLSAYLKECTKRASELKKELDTVEVNYTKQLKIINDAAELNKNIDQLAQVIDQLNQLREQKDSIAQVKKQIEDAKLAQTVEVHEKLVGEAKHRFEQWDQKVSDTKTQLTMVKVEVAELEEELIQAKNLEESKEQAMKQVQYFESLLPLLNSLEEKEKGKVEKEANLAKVTAKEKEVTASIQEVKASRLSLAEKMVQYETVDERLGDVKVSISDAKQLYESLQQALKLLDQIQKDEAALHQVQEQYMKEEQQMKAVKEQYEQKELLYRNATIGLAARYLVDNQPCPVCGSLEHPKKAVVSNEVPDETELEKEKKLLEEVQSSYNKIYNQAAGMQGALLSKRDELQRMQDNLKISDSNLLGSEFVQVREKSKQLITQRTNLEKLQVERDNCNIQLKQSETKLDELNQSLEQMKEKKSVIQSEYDILVGSIAHIRLQLPDEYRQKKVVEEKLQQCKSQVSLLEAKLKKLQERKEQLFARKESLDTLLISHEAERKKSNDDVILYQAQFNDSLENAGFPSVEHYQKAKLTKERLEENESTVQTYHNRMVSLQEQENQLRLRIDGKEKVDMNQLDDELTQITDAKRNLQSQIQLLASGISRNQRALESLKEKAEKIEKLSETYGYVKDLEKAAKGDNNERVVFEHYVLAAYFEDILSAANQRLSIMTNSRYELLKVNRVSDQRTKNSLDLEVLDQYTGKRRSVKTLSGGESFKAALSLALGLSDIIQQNAGGIEIDTLFIDEGFGSLDSESLEQALKTLTTLTGKNKLIGIISHVTELKERIDNQIVIEKDHNGSKLKVIS